MNKKLYNKNSEERSMPVTAPPVKTETKEVESQENKNG